MMGRQLGGLDMAFLGLEHVTAPMHFGALLVFDAAPTVGEFVRLLGERAARVPELRQRVEWGWCPPAGAVWAEDPCFRVEDHVDARLLRKPGDRGELLAAVAELMARPMDLTRPLWRFTVIDGLGGGRVAVFVELHHAMCDGPGAVELGLGLFDGFDDGVEAQPSAPRSLGFVRRVGTLYTPAPWVGIPAGFARSLVDRARHARESCAIVSSVISGLRPRDRSCSPRGRGSSRWRCELIHFPLSALHRIRARHGGTINDVLLTLVTGALRRWPAMPGRGRPVRALIPVNLRQAAPHASGRNQLSSYLCDLPIAEADPIKRLHMITTAMDRNKTTGPRCGAGAFPLLADRIPRGVLRLVTPMLIGAAPSLFDLVVTNVPLPDLQFALAGAPLREVYPFVPLAAGHAVSVALCTYRNRAGIGIHTDPHIAPEGFGASLRAALAELRTHEQI